MPRPARTYSPSGGLFIPPLQLPRQQVDQANPVQNQWYTLFAGSLGYMIHNLSIRVDDTGETLELELTMDGVIFTGSVAAGAGTNYSAIFFGTGAALRLLIDSGNSPYRNADLFDCRNLQIRFRKTTANGVGVIHCRAQIEVIGRVESWRNRAPAELNQVNSVQNQWYTVMPATPNCKVRVVHLTVQTTNETLQARITVDGNVFLSGTNAPIAAGTPLVVTWTSLTAEDLFLPGAIQQQRHQHLISGRSVMVEIRKITNNGNGNLQGRVYHQTR